MAAIDERIDVLIVGSGIAGLSAAVEAAAAGASTIVAEAEISTGGASAISGASCCIIGTPLQDEAGVADSVEHALADWESMGGDVDRERVRHYLERSRADVYDWLADLGVQWVRVTKPAGNSAARNHIAAGGGRAIVEAVRARAVRSGVQIRTGTKVVEIRGEGPIEVDVDGAEGRQTLGADAVVLATGGFAGSHDRLSRASALLRNIPRFVVGGAPSAQGTGHDLAASIGAALVDLENVWTYPIGTPDPRDESGTRGLALRGPITDIWLNRDGERFHDESDRSGRSGTDALLEQPGQTAWSVFSAEETAKLILMNNEYYSTPVGSDPRAIEEFLNVSPFVHRVSGAAAIGDVIGADPAVVKRSLSGFASAIAKGHSQDPATGRALAGVTGIDPVDVYVVQIFPVVSKNLGGVHTDLDCRVLTLDGVFLPGVFAAGELTGGAGGCLNGTGSLEGTLFGPSVYSGRIAGRNAADRARRARGVDDAQGSTS